MLAVFSLLTKINKLEKIGTVGRFVLSRMTDASISAGSQYAKKGDVSVAGVVADTLLGAGADATVGEAAARTAENSAEHRLAARAADRAERIAANNARAAKQRAAQGARDEEKGIVAGAHASSSVTGANVGNAICARATGTGECNP
jgi:hypothetical protein